MSFANNESIAINLEQSIFMKNNGKRLEQLVKLIQETLKNSPDTKVYSNHKIKDNSGSLREIDVFIDSIINKFNIKIAIECKEYKSPVSVDKIEAFITKCQRIPEINKRIFVSQSGYQSGAVKAAQEFGIELYNIDNIPSEVILSWFPIKMLGLRFEVVKHELYLDTEDIESISLKDNLIHFYNGSRVSTVKELIDNSIFEKKDLLWGMAILQFMKDEKSILNNRFSIPGQITLSGVYLNDVNLGPISIVGIEMIIEIFLEDSYPDVIESNSYGIYNEDKKINHLAISMGENEKASFLFIQEKLKIVISDDKGTNTPLVHLGTYDPKTGKYTRIEQ